MAKKQTINVKGIRLFFHQRVVADELTDWDAARGKTVVVKSSRQKGKSVLCSQLLLKYALGFNRATKNFYVAPTLRQSRMMYEMIVKGVSKAGIIRKSNSTELTIEFINGSSISFKSSEMGNALRGFTCSGLLVLDESAFQQDTTFYSLVKPWTEVHQAPILMLSTPYVRSGFFYQHYVFGLERTHNCVTIDWSEERFRKSIEQLLPPEKLAEYEQMLPSKIFRNEYLGEFCDTDGLVFQISRFEQNTISQSDTLYVGIDWSNNQGNDNDDTVVSMFNQDGKQVFLEYFNDLPKQVDRIYSRIEPYLSQISVIVSEINSLGTPYTNQLKEKSPILANKVIGWNTTNSNKNGLVVSLQTAIEKGEVALLPDSKQKEEFGYFTANFNPRTRTITYAAPEGTGLHDDIPMAVMFAWEARKNGQSTGKYGLVFKSPKYGHKPHHNIRYM